jgi:hypothetical protein
VQVDIVGQAVSRYSMSATRGPQDIISLVIPTIGDNNSNLIGLHMDKVEFWIPFKIKRT